MALEHRNAIYSVSSHGWYCFEGLVDINKLLPCNKSDRHQIFSSAKLNRESAKWQWAILNIFSAPVAHSCIYFLFILKHMSADHHGGWRGFMRWCTLMDDKDDYMTQKFILYYVYNKNNSLVQSVWSYSLLNAAFIEDGHQIKYMISSFTILLPSIYCVWQHCGFDADEYSIYLKLKRVHFRGPHVVLLPRHGQDDGASVRHFLFAF